MKKIINTRNGVGQSSFHYHWHFCQKESNIKLYSMKEFILNIQNNIHNFATCRSWKIPPVGTSFAEITSTGQYSPFSFCSKIWTQNSIFLVTSLHLGNSWSSWKIIHFYFNTGSLGSYTWELTMIMTSKPSDSTEWSVVQWVIHKYILENIIKSKVKQTLSELRLYFQGHFQSSFL